MNSLFLSHFATREKLSVCINILVFATACVSSLETCCSEIERIVNYDDTIKCYLPSLTWKYRKIGILVTKCDIISLTQFVVEFQKVHTNYWNGIHSHIHILYALCNINFKQNIQTILKWQEEIILHQNNWAFWYRRNSWCNHWFEIKNWYFVYIVS